MLAHFLHNSFFSPKSLALLALGFGLSPQANALDLNINPGSISLGSNSFTADTLIAGEVSNVTFQGFSGDFIEKGYGFITGAELGGSAVSSTGLAYTLDGPSSVTSQAGTFSLYFSFTDTGNAAFHTMNTGSFTFYAANGQSTFSIDNDNNAQVTNFGTTVELGTATLTSGSIEGDGKTTLSALTSTTFTPTANGASFFELSAQPYTISSTFLHIPSNGNITPLYVPGLPIQIQYALNVYGGHDTLSIAAVPELNEWIMMIIGLPMVTWLARRKQASGFSALFLGSKHAILG